MGVAFQYGFRTPRRTLLQVTPRRERAGLPVLPNEIPITWCREFRPEHWKFCHVRNRERLLKPFKSEIFPVFPPLNRELASETSSQETGCSVIPRQQRPTISKKGHEFSWSTGPRKPRRSPPDSATAWRCLATASRARPCRPFAVGRRTEVPAGLAADLGGQG